MVETAARQEESTASSSVVWEGRATGRELVPDNLPLVMGEAHPSSAGKDGKALPERRIHQYGRVP